MQEKQILEEKAKEKYEEWRKIKKKEEKEERLKRKQEQESQQQKLFEKKMSADHAYKLWLRENKKRNNSNYNIHHQRDNNDKFNNLYNPPSPNFVNPLPWVGTVVVDEEKSLSTKRNRNDKNQDTVFCSPPMLWEEVERRQKRKTNRIHNSSNSSRKSSTTIK